MICRMILPRSRLLRYHSGNGAEIAPFCGAHVEHMGPMTGRGSGTRAERPLLFRQATTSINGRDVRRSSSAVATSREGHRFAWIALTIGEVPAPANPSPC